MFLRHAVPVMEISNKLIASGCIFYSSTEFQGPPVCAQPSPDRPIISECIVDVCSVVALRKQCKFYKFKIHWHEIVIKSLPNLTSSVQPERERNANDIWAWEVIKYSNTLSRHPLSARIEFECMYIYIEICVWEIMYICNMIFHTVWFRFSYFLWPVTFFFYKISSIWICFLVFKRSLYIYSIGTDPTQ